MASFFLRDYLITTIRLVLKPQSAIRDLSSSKPVEQYLPFNFVLMILYPSSPSSVSAS